MIRTCIRTVNLEPCASLRVHRVMYESDTWTWTAKWRWAGKRPSRQLPAAAAAASAEEITLVLSFAGDGLRDRRVMILAGTVLAPDTASSAAESCAFPQPPHSLPLSCERGGLCPDDLSFFPSISLRSTSISPSLALSRYPSISLAIPRSLSLSLFHTRRKIALLWYGDICSSSSSFRSSTVLSRYGHGPRSS